MKSGFTLIELLVVIAIIAILAAILFPAFLAARAAAYQWQAGGGIDQIDKATIMYTSDNDDTYMLAMYWDRQGFQAWFGRYVSPGVFDRSTGLITPYEKSKAIKDGTAHSKDYLGDQSGFGYNWGFVGSDFSSGGDFRYFPQCANAATTTGLKDTSNTVVLATSAFYNAPWFPHGDGQPYDFGFIDPIGYCHGNPNVDFRHIEQRKVDPKKHTIVLPGNAVVAFADGHVKTMKVGQLKDEMFFRDSTTKGTQLDGSKLP